MVHFKDFRLQEFDISAYDPDLLATGLDVVFCGINPASSAAADGHNFSNRSNRFWTVLHRAGFTDVLLRPEDERMLLGYGCGITAVVTRPTEAGQRDNGRRVPAHPTGLRGQSSSLWAASGGLPRQACLSAMLATPDIAWGRQSSPFAGVTAWVLPNPSGLNRGFTLDALVHAYSELRAAQTEPS